MSWEHERVEELLAVHAIGGLDGEDAELVERALIEHVPECDGCRRAFDEYREVAADLSLAVPAVATPQILDARVRRTVGRGHRPSPVWVGTAAAAAILLGLSGFSVLRAAQLGDRLERAEASQSSLLGALSTVAHPEHQSVPLTGSGEEAAALYYVPGEERGYLMVDNLPEPRFAYHVWFTQEGETWHAGVLRLRDGRGVLSCGTDPARWDGVMLTDQARRGPGPRSSPLVSATVTAP